MVAAQSPFKEYRADDTLTILVPHVPLYPMSKIHVPVFIHPQEDSNIAVFIVRYVKCFSFSYHKNSFTVAKQLKAIRFFLYFNGIFYAIDGCSQSSR